MSDQKKLLIAYRSGVLDILPISATGQPRLDSIQTINTLRDAVQLTGSRRTNQLLRIGTDVYFATDFGIAVFDPTRQIVRDTYRNIGPGGSAVAVQSLALVGDSLFAATNAGLLSARFSANANLGFYGNWRFSPGPAGQIPTDLVAVNAALVASLPGRGVFRRAANSTVWVLLQPFLTNGGRIFPAPGGYVTLTSGAATLPDGSIRNAPRLTNPRDAVLTATNRLLVADSTAGLLAVSATGTQLIRPDGPASDVFQQVIVGAQTVLTLPGGVDANLNPFNGRTGFDVRIKGENWQSPTALPTNFGTAVFDPAQGLFWLGSFGGGLWQVAVSQKSTGSFLAPTTVILPPTIDPRISSLTLDANDNLWIATPSAPGNQPALHVRLAATGAFQSYQISRRDVVQIVIDDSGFLWLRLSPAFGGGILVYDPNTNRSRQLFTSINAGNLPASAVLTLVKDRTGAIWVGTSAGVTVFDDPARVFAGNVNARTPIFGRTGLLSQQTITTIAVDGANQKWIGTPTGLYRFSADGTKLLDNFTTTNSPLPANDIRSIGIDPVSGEVFVATANGLVIYRAGPTEPAAKLTDIQIFPNPVRPDFTGQIGIRGLTENAAVKILDAGGQLVFETRAQGGTATWDGRDYRGRAAQTGVYLVVVIGADGSEGLAGRLAIIR